MATAATSGSPTSYGRIGLRLLVVVIAATCLAEFWFGNLHTESYRIRYPLFSPRLWNLYLACSLGGLAASIAVWNWRRWGVILLAVVGFGLLFLEFYGMGFQLRTLRIPVAMTAVWLAVQPFWKRFH